MDMLYYIKMQNRRVAFWNRKSQKETMLTLGTKQKALSFVESMIGKDDNEFVKIGEKHSFYILNILVFKKPRITVTYNGANCLTFECINPEVKALEIKVQGLEIHELIELHASLCIDFEL